MSGFDLLELQQTLYTSANPTRRWLHCVRRDWVLERIRQTAVGGGRALEIGPGSGVYLPFLAQQFESVTATDIEKEFLANVRQLAQSIGGISVVEDDITSSRLPSGHFDLVLCSEVIEHIENSDRVLRNIHRILDANGSLILTTPQKYSVLELVARIAFLPGIRWLVEAVYAEPVLEMGHINLMTRRTVEQQLTEAGFEIVDRHICGFYLPLVAEFGGERGQRALSRLGAGLRGSILEWSLWTQCYVARKA